jgi:aminopeptidase N
MNRDFYHQTVETRQIEAYISKAAGRDLSKVFDQYLRRANIPALEYAVEKGVLSYRWINCVDGFDMPVRVRVNGKRDEIIYPTTEWKILNKVKSIEVDDNYYIHSFSTGRN